MSILSMNQRKLNNISRLTSPQPLPNMFFQSASSINRSTLERQSTINRYLPVKPSFGQPTVFTPTPFRARQERGATEQLKWVIGTTGYKQAPSFNLAQEKTHAIKKELQPSNNLPITKSVTIKEDLNSGYQNSATDIRQFKVIAQPNFKLSALLQDSNQSWLFCSSAQPNKLAQPQLSELQEQPPLQQCHRPSLSVQPNVSTSQLPNVSQGNIAPQQSTSLLWTTPTMQNNMFPATSKLFASNASSNQIGPFSGETTQINIPDVRNNASLFNNTDGIKQSSQKIQFNPATNNNINHANSSHSPTIPTIPTTVTINQPASLLSNTFLGTTTNNSNPISLINSTIIANPTIITNPTITTNNALPTNNPSISTNINQSPATELARPVIPPPPRVTSALPQSFTPLEYLRRMHTYATSLPTNIVPPSLPPNFCTIASKLNSLAKDVRNIETTHMGTPNDQMKFAVAYSQIVLNTVLRCRSNRSFEFFPSLDKTQQYAKYTLTYEILLLNILRARGHETLWIIVFGTILNRLLPVLDRSQQWRLPQDIPLFKCEQVKLEGDQASIKLIRRLDLYSYLLFGLASMDPVACLTEITAIAPRNSCQQADNLLPTNYRWPYRELICLVDILKTPEWKNRMELPVLLHNAINVLTPCVRACEETQSNNGRPSNQTVSLPLQIQSLLMSLLSPMQTPTPQTSNSELLLLKTTLAKYKSDQNNNPNMTPFIFNGRQLFDLLKIVARKKPQTVPNRGWKAMSKQQVKEISVLYYLFDVKDE